MIDIIFVTIIGLCVGSFLNVCIYRIPRNESMRGRSHCTNCKKTIGWYDNIPVLSFLFLRGRCRSCKKKISPRYAVVELITAVIFLVLFKRLGLAPEFFIFIYFFCSLIAASFIDIDFRIIPDGLFIIGMILGLVLSFIFPQIHKTTYNINGFIVSLHGAIVGMGLICLTAVVFDYIYFGLFKKGPVEGETESMGGGDIKLMGLFGAFLGWQLGVLAFFLGIFVGAIFGLINLVSKKSHLMPFGPSLAVGALLAYLWGDKILQIIFPY